MIMRDPRIEAKCPQCGSKNEEFKLSFTAVVAWLVKLPAVPAVKIFVEISDLSDLKIIEPQRLGGSDFWNSSLH